MTWHRTRCSFSALGRRRPHQRHISLMCVYPVRTLPAYSDSVCLLLRDTRRRPATRVNILNTNGRCSSAHCTYQLYFSSANWTDEFMIDLVRDVVAYCSYGGSGGFYRAMLCIRGTSHGPVSACVCVCLSQAGVLLKRLNVGSHKQHHTIVQGL